MAVYFHGVSPLDWIVIEIICFLVNKMITYHDPIMQLIHLQKIAIKRGNLENKYQIDIFKVQ